MSAGKNIFDGGPFRGEFGGAIKADGICAESFGEHVEITVPLKNVGIRKMKRFAQNDLPILPGERVAADGEADFAKVVGAVHDFEEEMP